MVATAAFAAPLAAFVVATQPAASAAPCPVTLPNLSKDPDAGFSANAFNYGNARIRVHLNWSDGVLRAGRLPGGGYVAGVNTDGSVYAKLGWWRSVRGRSRSQVEDSIGPLLRSECRSMRRAIRRSDSSPADDFSDDWVLASHGESGRRQAHLRGKGHEARRRERLALVGQPLPGTRAAFEAARRRRGKKPTRNADEGLTFRSARHCRRSQK